METEYRKRRFEFTVRELIAELVKLPELTDRFEQLDCIANIEAAGRLISREAHSARTEVLTDLFCEGLPRQRKEVRDEVQARGLSHFLADRRARFEAYLEEHTEDRPEEPPCEPGQHDWYDGDGESGPCEPQCMKCGASPFDDERK